MLRIEEWFVNKLHTWELEINELKHHAKKEFVGGFFFMLNVIMKPFWSVPDGFIKSSTILQH